MDVHLGTGFVHRLLGDVDVVVAVEVGMDATLEADLGGTDLGRLDDLLLHLLEGEQVGLAPEVED